MDRDNTGPVHAGSGSESVHAGSSAGRVAQRRRTRKAIVEAAIRLTVAGGVPTIDEIAKAADVSRRTIYMHFRTLDQLLADAAAGALSAAAVNAALDSDFGGAGPDPRARVDVLARALLDQADETLPLGRRLIRLTVDTPPGESDGPGTVDPRRGYRRVEWIESALEPVRAQLSSEQFERLVSSLALVIGWEAMIVLRDVRGLDHAEETATVTWAARALLDAMLAEARTPAKT